MTQKYRQWLSMLRPMRGKRLMVTVRIPLEQGDRLKTIAAANGVRHTTMATAILLGALDEMEGVGIE